MIARKHGPVTIGIDVSWAVPDVHVQAPGLRRSYANDADGHALLIGWTTSHQPERVIFEPTGAWHRALEPLRDRPVCLWSRTFPAKTGVNPARRPAGSPKLRHPGHDRPGNGATSTANVTS